MINESIERLRLDLTFGGIVRIDYGVLDEICRSIANDQSFGEHRSYAWDDPTYWIEDKKDKREVSQYFAVGNSINFRFWQLKMTGDSKIERCHGKKGGIECGGALYMWRSMKLCYDRGTFPILDSKKLSEVSTKDLKKIFRDDSERMPMPACDERTLNWRDLGKKLFEYWGGEFYNLLQSVV